MFFLFIIALFIFIAIIASVANRSRGGYYQSGPNYTQSVNYDDRPDAVDGFIAGAIVGSAMSQPVYDATPDFDNSVDFDNSQDFGGGFDSGGFDGGFSDGGGSSDSF